MDSLITRLEQAERGSTQLSIQVLKALAPREYLHIDALVSARQKDIPHGFRQTGITKVLGCPTTSLDACRKLQEEVLPDSYWTIDGGAPVIVDVFTKHPNAPFDGEHDDECLAWCIAILRAVETKEAQTAKAMQDLLNEDGEIF